MAKQVWIIRGYNGLEKTFQRSIPAGQLSPAEMTVTLQRLASRHLTDDEVVDSSLRKNAAGYAPHLEVHSGRDGLATTGTECHYAAVVRDAE